MVSRPFHGQNASVLHVEGAESDAPAQVLAEVNLGDQTGYISRSLLRAVCERQAPVMASNVAGQPDAIELTIEAAIQPIAALACPLNRVGSATEVLYVTAPPEYGTVEWLTLADLAAKQYQQVDTAWTVRRQGEAYQAIERELEHAREIQQRLVPTDVRIEGLEVAIGFEPCRWVGGDYADAVGWPDGRVLLTVADVCGKGIQAAIVTASVHTVVHAGVRVGHDVSQMINDLNLHLFETLPGHSFVTMVTLALDPATGEIDHINAGHPPVMLVDQDGTICELPSARNIPLGIADKPLVSDRARLEQGQMAALFTDGLTELADDTGRMLGVDGLSDHLRSICPAMTKDPLVKTADALTQRMIQIQGEGLPQDDRTFLLARRRDG